MYAIIQDNQVIKLGTYDECATYPLRVYDLVELKHEGQSHGVVDTDNADFCLLGDKDTCEQFAKRHNKKVTNCGGHVYLEVVEFKV